MAAVRTSVRSYLLAGVAAVGAAAVAFAPVQALPPDIAVTAEQPVLDASASREAVALLAAVQGLAVRPASPPVAPTAPTPDEVQAAVTAIQELAAPGAPATTAAADSAIEVGTAAFPGAANAIKDVYNLIEPYVAWGVEVAQWAVGWVPWVGLLSGQIGIFYTFGEAIVYSVVFNVADWIGGTVGFGEGLANIAAATSQAVTDLIRDEINWVRSFFPPLPPLPPVLPAALPMSLPTSLPTSEAHPAQQVGIAKAGAAAEVTGSPTATTVVEGDLPADEAPEPPAQAPRQPVQRGALLAETDPVEDDSSAPDAGESPAPGVDVRPGPRPGTALRDSLQEVARAATASVERARGAADRTDRRAGGATVTKKPTAGAAKPGVRKVAGGD